MTDNNTGGLRQSVASNENELWELRLTVRTGTSGGGIICGKRNRWSTEEAIALDEKPRDKVRSKFEFVNRAFHHLTNIRLVWLWAFSRCHRQRWLVGNTIRYIIGWPLPFPFFFQPCRDVSVSRWKEGLKGFYLHVWRLITKVEKTLSTTSVVIHELLTLPRNAKKELNGLLLDGKFKSQSHHHKRPVRQPALLANNFLTGRGSVWLLIFQKVTGYPYILLNNLNLFKSLTQETIYLFQSS